MLNAGCGRCVKSVWTNYIWNEAHLRRVLLEYVHYYNSRRPHQGLEQDSPEGLKLISEEGEIQCRDVLGGIIHDYYRRAA